MRILSIEEQVVRERRRQRFELVKGCLQWFFGGVGFATVYFGLWFVAM